MAAEEAPDRVILLPRPRPHSRATHRDASAAL